MKIFKLLKKLFERPVEESEVKVKELLGFLVDDYGCTYSRVEFKKAVNEKGDYFFHGPVYVYIFYNESICINVVYLVQRQEYDLYITDRFSTDQVYIRNGKQLPGHLAYKLESFSEEIRRMFEGKIG